MKEYNNQMSKKIAEIRRHLDYNDSRAINAILAAIQNGASLLDEERLFLIVQQIYAYSKPHRMPSHIRQTFKMEYKFLLREFRESENVPDELYYKYFKQ